MNKRFVKTALQTIKRNFPYLTWNTYHIVTHGWDHMVIILDNKLIFRIPKATSQKTRRQFYQEIQLLHYLKKRITVGIPDYRYLSKDYMLGGYPILAGRTLTPLQFKRLSKNEKTKITHQLATFLTTLHTTPRARITKYGVKTEQVSKEYKIFVHNIRKLLFPRLTSNAIKAIETYFRDIQTVLHQPHANVLVHNDLTREHILWDKTQRHINIIDFGDCAVGDPAVDFAGLLDYGKEFIQHVYASYRGKKDAHLLERAQLYYMRIPLSMMVGALQGQPSSFRKGYRLFKQRFKLEVLTHSPKELY